MREAGTAVVESLRLLRHPSIRHFDRRVPARIGPRAARWQQRCSLLNALVPTVRDIQKFRVLCLEFRGAREDAVFDVWGVQTRGRIPPWAGTHRPHCCADGNLGRPTSL